MTGSNSTYNRNPWLSIPAADYQGHMNAENVGQLAVLNRIFRTVLKEIPAKRLAVLGCGTGNGFEHINSSAEKVLGIDINPEYLSLLWEKFVSKLPTLELACADLSIFSYSDNSFDLIYAALIFEYVDFEKVLKKAADWLVKSGILVAVLQLPSTESEMISETGYSSLKSLEKIMRLVEAGAFNRAANKYGLKKSKETEMSLKSGKKLLVCYYTKA